MKKFINYLKNYFFPIKWDSERKEFERKNKLLKKNNNKGIFYAK